MTKVNDLLPTTQALSLALLFAKEHFSKLAAKLVFAFTAHAFGCLSS